jgi:integrase/recombinase XerD
VSERHRRDSPLRGLRLAAWPEGDRSIWLAALEPAGLLDEGGARAHCRPSSNANVQFGYGRWLAWLQHTGRLAEHHDPGPASRLTEEAVISYLASLAKVNSTGTLIQQVLQLCAMARVLAPQADWSWLLAKARQLRRMRRRHAPVRDKQAVLAGTRQLFDLGAKLIGQAAGKSGWERALWYRDGLIIALLALRPLRIGNFSSLRLGRHLHQRGQEWWIALTADETKNRMPTEQPLPAMIAPWLESYLLEHRATLLGRGLRPGNSGDKAPAPSHLWLFKEGQPMAPQAFRKLVRNHTAACFGQPLTPHLFRDCAVTSVAISDPGRVGIASQLLVHRGPETAVRDYNQARAPEAAVRMLEARQHRLREDKPPSHPAPPPRHDLWKGRP